jgi:pimeloyl-ACP methyl ester carboxylesterase
VLSGLSAYAGPAMVVYGEHDIFGPSADIVRNRLPHAVQVMLHGSGHRHWLQGEPSSREALRQFFATRCEAIA